ncbi:MAG: hypothetical protein IPJ69_06240 [Deltaproteobacteria bacterium]|nr:MAG: hypothetical protein IPJ69_06240 [Deltaproteobacteria bacterium]
MIAVRQDEYDELRRAQNERSNHSLWLGGLGAIIALGVGIGRVVEARRRNMIEMAKAGSFHEADWEGWLRWILPDRFYTSLNLMNAKANPTSVEPLTLEDDHH